MTFKKALEKNKSILDKMESEEGKMIGSKKNEEKVREYLLKSLSDSGFVALEVFVGTYWKI